MSGPFRFAVPVLLSLLILSTSAVVAWLLSAGTDGGLILLIVGLQALVLLGAVWIAFVLLELRIFRPIRRLGDHLGVFLCSDSDHRLEADGRHSLGELPERVEELGRRLMLERRETARTMEAVAERIDHRKSRLEAILRDLHEGVIVCNDEHRIVLFNQTAARVLEGAGPVGLHRPVTALFSDGALQDAYASLRQRLAEQPDAPLRRKVSETTMDGRRVELRLSPIVESDQRCAGYVLSFPGGDEGEGRDHAAGILSDRPEFYDFSLFESRGDRHDMEKRLETLDYVVFDTETTGLNPSGGDHIVQISGIRVVNGRPTGEVFDTLVNPGVPIPPASIRFHGITDDMVTEAPGETEAARSFRTFVEGAVMVAHNAAFDMKFLAMLESRSGVVFDNPVLDTLLLSFVLQPNHGNHTLDAIAARFAVSISDEVRHTALGDARATAEIFVKMLPALRRSGLETLGHALEASNRVFHIRRMQDQL